MADVPKLADYYISDHCGFNLEEPLENLPEYFDEWNRIGKSVGRLLDDEELRVEIEKMPLLDHRRLKGYRQWRCAYMYLSFMGNGFIWQDGDKGIKKMVPSQLAIPWHATSKYLGLKPAICHAAFALSNYTKIDPNGPLELGNIRTLSEFRGGRACEWFVICTVQVEMEALPGIKAVLNALEAVVKNDALQLEASLQALTQSIKNMQGAVARMKEELPTDIFYLEVRPFLTGWGGASSVVPEGIVFEGVSETSLKITGGSAAQSSPIQCFDACLDIVHDNEKQKFLEEMREYMPPAHKDFILAIKKCPSVRKFVTDCGQENLTNIYNQCVQALVEFRNFHVQIVCSYIVNEASKQQTHNYKGIVKKGTGGQDLMPFLKGLRNTTSARVISS